MQAHVLSIGQCTADDARLARVLAVEADAHLDRAATLEDARQAIAHKSFDLVMVNRILDLDGESGIDLIGTLKREGVAVPMMLISDYPEAQEAAMAQGAVQGFGKARLGTAEVGQLLRQALHSAAKAGMLK